MKWWMVDPVKKTKTPLWDNAKIAAQLTRILRTPYDAQHLPIDTIRFIDNDTKIRFSVTLPRDAKVENAAGEEITGETQTQEDQVQGGGGARRRRGGGRGGQQDSRAAAAARAGARRRTQTKQWWLDYDLATGTVVLNDKYEAGEDRIRPGRASHPTSRPSIFARGHNLFMMDAKNFELAKKKADDPAIAGDAAHDRRREVLQLRAQRRGRPAAGRSATAAGPERPDDARAAARARNARSRPSRTRSSARARAAIGVTWSQDNKKFSVMRTDQRKVDGPVGHQRARQSAPDARDLQVRHARRGEPAADRARTSSTSPRRRA